MISRKDLANIYRFVDEYDQKLANKNILFIFIDKSNIKSVFIWLHICRDISTSMIIPKSKQVEVNNDFFKEYSEYSRDALVLSSNNE